MSTRTRLSALGGAFLLLLIASYGLWRLSREYPRNWASLSVEPSRSGSPRLALDRQLQPLRDGDPQLLRGWKAPLASFVAANGRTVTLFAIGGEFFDRAIMPHEVWQGLGPGLLLVSSVDEHRSSFGPLAEATSKGCAIPPGNGLQALGEASIVDCSGNYRSLFGITSLAQLSVVVEENPGSDRGPCWQRFGLVIANNDYQDCVHASVADAFESLFQQLRDSSGARPAGIILPAVGTGTGGLSKAAFYRLFVDERLIDELQSNPRVPSSIYLQVRTRDAPQQRIETAVGISAAVAKAVEKWRQADHKPPASEWLTLTGVSLGGALLLFALASGARLAWTAGSIPSLEPIGLVAWLAAAVGVASMFKAFVSLVPGSVGPYAQVAAGVIAAIFAGPLTIAADNARQSLQEQPERKEEEG